MKHLLAILPALLLTAAAPQDAGIRDVVAGIAHVAAENAARPAEERVAGDALADLYV